jgi:glutathionyl-hydroquinone reductase
MQTVYTENYNDALTVFILKTDKDKTYVGNRIHEVIQLLASDWKNGEASRVTTITQVDGDDVEREVIDTQ